MKDKVKCFLITLDKGTNPYVEKDIDNALIGIRTEMEESCAENKMTIETIEMTEEEYKSLPEWGGP